MLNIFAVFLVILTIQKVTSDAYGPPENTRFNAGNRGMAPEHSQQLPFRWFSVSHKEANSKKT